MSKYKHQVIVNDQKAAWAFTDWLDDRIIQLCWETSQVMSSAEHRSLSIDEFGTMMYEVSDVGGIRDAIIEATQDVMNCELVFDYPY